MPLVGAMLSRNLRYFMYNETARKCHRRFYFGSFCDHFGRGTAERIAIGERAPMRRLVGGFNGRGRNTRSVTKKQSRLSSRKRRRTAAKDRDDGGWTGLDLTAGLGR